MQHTEKLMVGTFIGLVCAAMACQSVRSSDIRTSGIRAEIAVSSSSPERAQVEVLLKSGSSYLSLTGDDRLVVYYAGSSTIMESKIVIPGQARYVALLDSQATEAELRVAFERGAKDVSAPNSTVTLPATLKLSSLATMPYSRSHDELKASWTPVTPSDRVEYMVSGPCVTLVDVGPASDPGGFTIPTGTLHKPKPSSDPSQTPTVVPDICSASITVNKEREGKVDPAFTSGTFKVLQQVMVSFESIP